MAKGLFGWLSAAPHKERLPEAEVQRQYPWLRWQVLEATFLGYAMYYLVRNNFSVVSKDFAAAFEYTKDDIGNIMAVTAAAYGIGKFVMGALSDRSNPRAFMALGLVFTAVCNFAFGSSTSYDAHFWLWALNGFVQGMGWPPCGRSMGHWFSENERGLTFSIWNTSHNLGGGIAGVLTAEAVSRFGGWQYGFYVPGVIALFGAVYLLWRLRDTPQSCGLPPVEEYRNDLTETQREHGTLERELSYRELLFDNVLMNKWIWLLAFANFFAYITRYSMLDWGPMYLREVKGATIMGGGFSTLLLEFGGIPSTILLGWLTDKMGRRRGAIATLSMLPILVAFCVILVAPAHMITLDLAMLFIIGFFIYPVINLIVIIALDLTSKKAIGTAAGFIGLFGYAGRMVMVKSFGWFMATYEPIMGKEAAWRWVIAAIIASGVMSFLLLALTWRVRPRA